jgi:hypothetical protein
MIAGMVRAITAPTDSLPLEIKVGGITSPSNITIAVSQ